MKLMTGLFVFLAVVVLLAAGHARIARTSDARIEDGHGRLGTRSGMSDNPVMSRRGDVPEVVVRAERPDWVMPEVVVRANRMPEVVVHASQVPAELSALPWGAAVN